MCIKLVKLNEVDSTNVYLCEHADCFNEEMVVVQADYQTSGKGQGQNGWESKAGKNLLYSLLVHPQKLPVKSQFFLSMAGALSIKAVLQNMKIDKVSHDNLLYLVCELVSDFSFFCRA